MDFMAIFDALITGYGIYLVYVSFQMKRTGEINSVIINKEDIFKCKDQKGYIEYIYKKSAFFGMVAAVFGGIGLINDFVHTLGITYNMISVVVFIAAWFWFVHILHKGRDQFF